MMLDISIALALGLITLFFEFGVHPEIFQKGSRKERWNFFAVPFIKITLFSYITILALKLFKLWTFFISF